MNDAMAQPPAKSSPSSLTLRVISAAVMLPVALAAIWLGGWVFAALVAAAAGLMFWEWQGLCGEKGDKAKVFALACAFGPLGLLAAGPNAALAGWAALTLAVGLVNRRHRLFLAGGFAYIFIACLALTWLRGFDRLGMTVIWLVAVVVMTDTCAYFTGRTLGGPKLAPKISPKKTWSGLIGGIVGAAAAGAAIAAYLGGSILAVALVSGAFAVVAQIGDLAISKAKRAFGVKDSSNIIPGHGGVLDRFDGILSASAVMGLLALLGGGSPLSWQ